MRSWDLIESVSGGFPTYPLTLVLANTVRLAIHSVPDN